MPSIVPGFEYDIFISYRHNDNRSGWVTDFVKHLNEELATTIKEPVRVYFDSNPHDGLLETHNVDKSLEGKLKCLIFLPIVSQTYCDLKSFAWQNEFCAFNKLAKDDSFGRDVKLGNGNVASRILPIKIHDLDLDDKESIENEICGSLRAIEFIYKEPGVNRPLKPTDNKTDNQNKTDYRNQLNKVANAVKEIASALKNPEKKSQSSSIAWDQSFAQKSLSAVNQEASEKSIAVLPFLNLSQDSSQEYFADGITENILIQISSLRGFRVTSRTSVMRFKKTTKTAPEIAADLGVKYIVEGSAQSHANKVRISVQLVNAVSDEQMWSKVFIENLDDIFTIQNNVAEAVVKELSSSLQPEGFKKNDEPPTKNSEAYDLFLKGRHAFNQWSMEGYRTASDYFRKAIEKDPDFRDAYSYMASSYSARMSWNGDLSPQEALKNILPNLNEAWKRKPSDNDYLTKVFIEFFVNKDFNAAEKFLLSAFELNSNNATVLYTYSYVLCMMGRFEEASQWVDRSQKIDPLTIGYFNYRTISLYFLNQHEEALATLREAIQLFPNVVRFYDLLARVHLTIGNHKEARDAVLAGFESSRLRPPSMVAFLSAAFSKLSEIEKAKELIDELTERSATHEKGVNIYLVHSCFAVGDIAAAKHWLTKAKQTNDVDLVWWNVDPLLKSVREEFSNTSLPDFEATEKHLWNWLEKQMPKLPYHNIDHIKDVFQSAIVIAEHGKMNENEIKILRIAALLHDAGFIHSAKDHEQKGADMANQMLPEFGFDTEQIEIISKMILATKLPQSPTTQLEKILCDADLDYLGRDDFYETGGKLCKEMLAAGVVETEREWNLVQRTFLQSHQYHTAFSQQNREQQKQMRLGEIAEWLKRK